MKSLSSSAAWSVVLAAAVGLGTSAQAGFVVENAFPAAEFDKPVQVVFLPDGRSLVAEKRGFVRTVLPDGTLEAYPFLNVQRQVYGIFDFGLLSVAIDPDFPTEDWVYVLYVVDPNEDAFDDAAETDKWIRVSRYRYHPTVPNLADTSSRQDLIGATWPDGIPTLHTSHSAGTLRFGADKSLLISAGEGAHWETIDSGGLDPDAFLPGRTDPSEDLGAFRARSIDSLAGKVLRIDKETGGGLPSNPHYDGNPFSDRSRVWAYGMRNPFRTDFVPGTGSSDPTVGDPGVLVVGDVGSETIEWVHVVESGGYNGGWPCFEGSIVSPGYPGVASTAAGNDDVLCASPLSDENPLPHAPPVMWWHHSAPDESNPVGWIGSSITAGTFYGGGDYPDSFDGAYAVADFVGDWIRWVFLDETYQVTGSSTFLSATGGPVNIERHPVSGDLYYVAYFANEVRHIRYEDVIDVETPGAADGSSLAVLATPNPFRGRTAVTFHAARRQPVTVRVFDATGRHLRTIVEGRPMGPGPQLVDWDGHTSRGEVTGPGTYFVEVTVGERIETRKLVQVR